MNVCSKTHNIIFKNVSQQFCNASFSRPFCRRLRWSEMIIPTVLRETSPWTMNDKTWQNSGNIANYACLLFSQVYASKNFPFRDPFPEAEVRENRKRFSPLSTIRLFPLPFNLSTRNKNAISRVLMVGVFHCSDHNILQCKRLNGASIQQVSNV